MTNPTPEQIEAGVRAYDPEAWRSHDRLVAEGASGAALELMVAHSILKASAVLVAAAGAAPRAEYHRGYQEGLLQAGMALHASIDAGELVDAASAAPKEAGGDHAALIADARSRAGRPATGANVVQCLRECTDALEAAANAPVQVDEAKLAEVIWEEQKLRALCGYLIHTRATAATTAAAVAEWLRGGGRSTYLSSRPCILAVLLNRFSAALPLPFVVCQCINAS